ncbi:MAG: gamma-glutamyltransferase [Phycisphaerae bacterium]
MALSAGWLAVAACAPVGSGGDAREWLAVGRQAMVASDSVDASRAGVEVLRAGGNAVDAAVATSFALAVTRPYSMGLGGGGFMMIRMAKTGEVFVLDYRERAPAAATADMFVQARAANPQGPSPSEYGGLAAGVPGLVAGHAAVLERLGTRTLSEVIEPAVALAADGFDVDRHYCSVARECLADMRREPALARIGAELRKTYLFDGREPRPGERLRQPALARALGLIRDRGPEAFYRGPIARAIVEANRAAGGVLALEDLAGYRPTWREPLRLRYRDRYEILLMPPPSSGGICIAETLNILEHWDLAGVARRDPGLAAHLTIEALKHAFADRAGLLGDADFAEVPVGRLIDKSFARRLAARIREDRAIQVNAAGGPPRDAGTSHFSVVDRWGNVVACTETINTSFGSWVMVPEYGIVLNNEMDDFTAEPGKPNAFGLRQSEANAVAPGKRPLSSMSPTIVLRDGRPVLALGAAGGPRIITGTLQVMLNVIEYGQPLERAIEQPRLHHQWMPDVVYRNQFAADAPVIAGLRRRGHRISAKRQDAVVQAIQIEPGRLIGASDPRKGGQPLGY